VQSFNEQRVFDDYVAVRYSDHVSLSPRPFDFNTPIGVFAQHYFQKEQHRKQYASIAISSWSIETQNEQHKMIGLSKKQCLCSVKGDNQRETDLLEADKMLKYKEFTQQHDNKHIKDVNNLKKTKSKSLSSSLSSTSSSTSSSSSSSSTLSSHPQEEHGVTRWIDNGYAYKRENGVLYRKKIRSKAPLFSSSKGPEN